MKNQLLERLGLEPSPLFVHRQGVGSGPFQECFEFHPQDRLVAEACNDRGTVIRGLCGIDLNLVGPRPGGRGDQNQGRGEQTAWRAGRRLPQRDVSGIERTAKSSGCSWIAIGSRQRSE